MRTVIKKLTIVNYYYVALVSSFIFMGMTIKIPWAVSELGFADAVNKVFIKPKIEGVLAEILVKEEDKVKKGQLLARIKDPASEVFKTTYLAELALAKMRYEQAKIMFNKGFISSNEFLLLQKDYEIKDMKVRQLQDYDIFAPMDGTVFTTDEIKLREGDNLLAGTVLATIANLEQMVFKSSIPDYKISKVQIGQEVRCYITAFPSTIYGTIKGHVKDVLPQAIVNDKGVFFVVIVSLDKPYLEKSGKKIFLRPGMSATLKIIYERTPFVEHFIYRGFDVLYKKGTS